MGMNLEEVFMAKPTSERRNSGSNYQNRQKRWQRILFVVLAIIIILSWIVSLVVTL
jgi:hypothetical protein